MIIGHLLRKMVHSNSSPKWLKSSFPILQVPASRSRPVEISEADLVEFSKMFPGIDKSVIQVSCCTQHTPYSTYVSNRGHQWRAQDFLLGSERVSLSLLRWSSAVHVEPSRGYSCSCCMIGLVLPSDFRWRVPPCLLYASYRGVWSPLLFSPVLHHLVVCSTRWSLSLWRSFFWTHAGSAAQLGGSNYFI